MLPSTPRFLAGDSSYAPANCRNRLCTQTPRMWNGYRMLIDPGYLSTEVAIILRHRPKIASFAQFSVTR